MLSDYIRSREADLPDQVIEAADAVAPTGTEGQAFDVPIETRTILYQPSPLSTPCRPDIT